MIVITTPTGQIGSKIIPDLLSANERVRVVVRDPEKIAANIRERVDVVTGSLDDETTMNRALDGAEGVFLLVPPSPRDTNDTRYFMRFTRPAIAAITKQRVKRVVGISVLGKGTDLAKNAGPITAALAKDAEIEQSGVDYRAVWCPGLMDNMLWSIETIKNHGVFFLPSRPDVKRPQAATKDVAQKAAELLLDKSWAGQDGIAVLGPEDLSYDDMAAIASDVLRKTIRFVSVAEEQYKATMKQHGANEVFAQGIVDMMRAKDQGLDNFEQRTAGNTTSTSFRQWCEEVLKPAVHRRQGAAIG